MPFLHSLLSPWDYVGFHAFFFTIFFLTKLHLQAAIPHSTCIPQAAWMWRWRERNADQPHATAAMRAPASPEPLVLPTPAGAMRLFGHKAILAHSRDGNKEECVA